jgi:ankyrin repeat protein
MLAAYPDLANTRDEAGDSPVLMATYMGKADVVHLLLARGARPSFFEACALPRPARAQAQSGLGAAMGPRRLDAASPHVLLRAP